MLWKGYLKAIKFEDFPERLLKEITNTGAARKYVEEWIRKYYPDVTNLPTLKMFFLKLIRVRLKCQNGGMILSKNPKNILE